MKKCQLKTSRGFCGISYVTMILVASDFLAIFCAFVLAYVFRNVFSGILPFASYVELLPFLCIFPLLFSLVRLYPGVLLHPAEELKRLFFCISAGFLLLATLFFLAKTAEVYSRLFLLVAFTGAILFVPLFRLWVRTVFHKKAWWQIQAIFFGTPNIIPLLALQKARSRFLGLHLVCICMPLCKTESMAKGTLHSTVRRPEDVMLSSKTKSDFGSAPETFFDFAHEENIEICSFDFEEDLEKRFEELAVKHPEAVLFMYLPSIVKKSRHGLIETAGSWFRQVFILPGNDWLPCQPSQIFHLGSSFGLSIRRNLADKRRLRLKRCIDLVFMCFFCCVAIPLGLILTVLIRLDSKGATLYWQQRIGKDGQVFKVCKFRTMVNNSEATLADYLQKNPEAAKEWQQEQKLKNDPRITRVGKFLRKTSLDELPQIINIVKGEMSLVGPRPIVEDEVAKYGDVYSLYTQCLPGITGLWQVSGRSDTDYATRVNLDKYYINNWSVWLDIYIIFRTIPVVLLQRGAY